MMSEPFSQRISISLVMSYFANLCTSIFCKVAAWTSEPANLPIWFMKCYKWSCVCVQFVIAWKSVCMAYCLVSRVLLPFASGSQSNHATDVQLRLLCTMRQTLWFFLGPVESHDSVGSWRRSDCRVVGLKMWDFHPQGRQILYIIYDYWPRSLITLAKANEFWDQEWCQFDRWRVRNTFLTDRCREHFVKHC